jgi:hypothetical protein
MQIYGLECFIIKSVGLLVDLLWTVLDLLEIKLFESLRITLYEFEAQIFPLFNLDFDFQAFDLGIQIQMIYVP